MSHRGPDGYGIHIDNNIAIGHRRLSIIDLATGTQPMKNDAKSLIITYNGELYNYLEIKKVLINKGYQFKTTSDTEVVLKSYEEWRKECVKKFRGMFAFGIIDYRNQELFLARDPLGIKPLVYYTDDQVFAFTSEINSLKKIEGFCNEHDLLAMDQYLTYQYIPAPRTIYRKVKKLLPGHFLIVGFNGTIKLEQSYWDIGFKPNHIPTKNQWVESLDKAIEESVKLHTISDVDFGAFLSGGLDSTIIVKYMTRVLGYPVKTFTIGFKEKEYNETEYANRVAKKYGTQHTNCLIEEDALSILPNLVKHYGEPFGDFSAVPTYFVSKIASSNVKMVLSGDGGDEIFAGYSTYPWWLRYEENNPIYYKSNTVKRLYPFANWILPGKYPKLSTQVDQLSNYLKVRTRLTYNEREQLWQPQYRYLLDIPYENIEKYNEAFHQQTTLSRAQYFDIKTSLPGDILMKVDTASMLNSLEVRTPLIDKDIFELAARIPSKYLMNNHTESAWQGKLILKELLKGDFEDSFINRPKRGFEIPLDKWLGGANQDKLKAYFEGTNNPLFDFFVPEKLKEISKGNDYYTKWLLLVLHEWLIQN
jgi:asparagine synthase (glutamine-hydrolysing)